MATLLGIVSVVVNVGVSFMTDGNWKTAGTGLAQFYWNHANRRSEKPPQLSRPHCGKSVRFSWNGTLSSVPAFD